MEQLSRENGVLLSDRVTPCVPQSDEGKFISLLTRVAKSTLDKHRDSGQCIIYFLGMEINTASFALYAFSISVLLQALVVVSISCAADHGSYRKRLLLAFAAVGSIATMLFIVVVPQIYLLGAVLAIASNVCFGASFVLLNSFLPLLVRHHPETQHLDEDAQEIRDPIHTALDQHRSSETSSLLPNSAAFEKTTSAEMMISTRISSTGIGIGYSAGLFVQCLSILLILSLHSTTFSLRLTLSFIGLWWFVFTIPSALWLRPRPGPPLPLDPKTGTARTWVSYAGHSWKSLYRTLTHALALKDITLFLLAWFLLSDAIATVSSTAILFAKTQLHMSPPYLALINVIATTAGILGAFAWSFLSRLLKLRPTTTILLILALFELIPLYGLLAYIPAVQRSSWGGLQQPWEMYPLGFVYGLVLGGLSSYCRSLFGELIPEGSEAAFYALYAITDKGSSVFGPAIVGMIIDKTGQIRAAFWFLAVLVGLPAPILYFVNIERGKREGTKMKQLIEGFRREDAGNSSVTGIIRNGNSENDLAPVFDRTSDREYGEQSQLLHEQEELNENDEIREHVRGV